MADEAEAANATWQLPDMSKLPQLWPYSPGAPYDPSTIKGKTVLITGGASGIGAAFAREWARYGAYIFIGDVNTAAGEALIAEIRTLTGSPHHHFQRCDVTDWQSQVALFKTAINLSPTGGIDTVVPNAGIGTEGGGSAVNSFEIPGDLDRDHPPPPNLKVIDVNFTGVMYTVHLALFWLPKNGPVKAEGYPDSKRDRHILLIGSIASLLPLVGSAQYTATKHAVTGLFRSLRGTAWYSNIRVNLLCPCFVDTPLLANSILLLLAGGGLGELSDVVEAATRFVADDSLFGRSVVVGPRMRVEDAENGFTRLVEIPAPSEDVRGIYEAFVQDYTYAEAFSYRYTRLLVGIAKMRGWTGWAKDVFWALFLRKSK